MADESREDESRRRNREYVRRFRALRRAGVRAAEWRAAYQAARLGETERTAARMRPEPVELPALELGAFELDTAAADEQLRQALADDALSERQREWLAARDAERAELLRRMQPAMDADTEAFAAWLASGEGRR